MKICCRKLFLKKNKNKWEITFERSEIIMQLKIRYVSDELKITLDKLQKNSLFETQNSFLLNILEEYASGTFQKNKSHLFLESEKELITALMENTEALNKLFVACFEEDEVSEVEN